MVAAVLELIRPSLQADGGDVRLVDVNEDGVVSVELQGACKGCPMSQIDAGQRRGAHPQGARSRRDEGRSGRPVNRIDFEGEGGGYGAVLGTPRVRRGDDVALPAQHPGRAVPADCRFAACTRSTHEVCQDFNNAARIPERDYDAAVKEVCRFCEHFLEHGPGVAERTGEVTRQGNPNRFLL